MQALATVLFSNGISIVESEYDLTYWRKVLQYARSNDVKIKTLTIGGRVIDKNADWYFIIGQVTSYQSSETTVWERGVGSVRVKDPRTRIEWYDLETNTIKNVKVEEGIINGLKEFGIERDK